LIKLRRLHISNTDISAGVEYLPISLKEIYCSANERPASLVTAIAEQLSNSRFFVWDQSKVVYVSTQREPTYQARA